MKLPLSSRFQPIMLPFRREGSSPSSGRKSSPVTSRALFRALLRSRVVPEGEAANSSQRRIIRPSGSSSRSIAVGSGRLNWSRISASIGAFFDSTAFALARIEARFSPSWSLIRLLGSNSTLPPRVKTSSAKSSVSQSFWLRVVTLNDAFCPGLASSLTILFMASCA